MSEGDLVEYWIPPTGFGYPERVGMLGLVVQAPAAGEFCLVLWARFSHQGPQWYKARNLRSASENSLGPSAMGAESGVQY